MSRNLAASIRVRLKQHADAAKQDFNLILTHHGLEWLFLRPLLFRSGTTCRIGRHAMPTYWASAPMTSTPSWLPSARSYLAPLLAKGRAAAGVAAVSGSRQVVFRRAQLIQQHLGHRFEAVRYKFSIEGGRRWQGHVAHLFNIVNQPFVQFQRFVNLFRLA